jgi:hypothetical protein
MGAMNDPKDDRPYRQPVAPPAARGKGILDETRELVDQLLTEAQRREAEQRASIPPRGPVGKALVFATVVAAAMAAGTMLYGAYNFLDAPIRETPTGYVNKAGKPYPREHYEAFKLWEKTFIATFCVAFAVAAAMAVEEQIRKRR